MDALGTVSDSSDWPATMPELRTIDTLLRCPICYEFLKTAMMIPECSHNFCSLCIRTYMAYKNQCPTCSISFLETNLKNNRVLDDIVKNFLDVRPQILKMCKDNQKQKSPASAASDRSTTTAVTSGQGQNPKTPVHKKVCMTRQSPSTSKSSSDDDPDFEPSTKSPRMHLNQLTPRQTTSRSCLKTLTSSTEEDEEEDRMIEPTPSKPKEMSTFTIPSPITPTTVNNNNTRASCPVCGVSVLERFINTHLDRCLASEQKKDSLRSKRRPLLKFVYNLMTDKELRKKLKEYNVSHQGTRQVLIKRLKDFALLYNSYCDADNPKSVELISKEFENMERIKMKNSNEPAKDKLVLEKGNSDEQMEKLRKKYLTSHKSQFDKMIEETRKRQLKMKASATKSKAPSTESTSSIGSVQDQMNKPKDEHDTLSRSQDSLPESLDSSRRQQRVSESVSPVLSSTLDLPQGDTEVYTKAVGRDTALPVGKIVTKTDVLETSQCEIPQDLDDSHSKSLLSPTSTSGDNSIPESPIFHATTVSRRLGRKRKDHNDCSTEDREDVRRSKRNKPDSQ